MHDPSHLLLFLEVAQRRSIAAAARELRMSRATATRRLAALEESLGVQLVRRTTNDLSLTEAGHIYLEHAQTAHQALKRAEDAVRLAKNSTSGLLRIAAPILPAQTLITPLLREFSELHPEVRLEVVFDADVRKLVGEGFDLGLQVGLEENPSLLVRQLILVKRRLVASTEYLKARGEPSCLEELGSHACLVSKAPSGFEPWPLLKGEGTYVPPEPRLICNSQTLVQSAVEAGMGIALMPLILVERSLAQGQLKPVLTQEVGKDLWVSLVVATHRIIPPKVRAFVDFTVQWVKSNVKGEK